MKIDKILFLAFVGFITAFAQTAEAQNYSTKNQKAIKAYEDALKLYDAKRNEEARAGMEKALKFDGQFIEARIVLGDILTDMKRLEEAAECFHAVVNQNPDFFVNAQYQLGVTQLKLSRYVDAQKNFEEFMKRKRVSPAMKEKAERQIENAKFGEMAVKNPVPFEPKNLGQAINTPDYEYFPALTADEKTLIFTRNHRNEGGQGYQEDFYISFKGRDGWQRALNLGPPINTDDNEGAQSISADGQTLVFTACNRRDGLGSCDLHLAKKVGDRWGAASLLGPPVSSHKWESQPSIAADGRTLYFASNRPGGMGGTDLWVTRLDDQGLWSTPQPLGAPVNTKGNEETPFIHPDGRTLYFTTDGHIGMGGKDIFYTRMADDGTWSLPINLGYPINTANDELGLIVGASGTTAYYASDRDGGQGNLDLYSFELYADARPTPVTYLKGTVADIVSNFPLEATFELIDIKTNKVVATASSDRVNGSFLVCLPKNRKYALNVSRKSYLFYSDHFSIDSTASIDKPFELDIRLQPIKFGEKVVLRNIFFETGSYELKQESMAELEKLLSFLNSNMEIAIEIGGHTDNVGKDDDNLRLSENRANAVRNWLMDKGVKDSRLTANGYGKTMPIASNETPEGRATNRRTEFMVKERK